MNAISPAIIFVSAALAGCGQHIAATGQGGARPDPAMIALVDSAAWRAGVSPRIAHAVVRQESGYKPHIRGAAGEWGLGQIKCPTARAIGFDGPCQALRDPAVNLTYSMKFLRLAIDKGGESCAGVSLYNTGIHTRPRCTAYGRSIMRRAQ